MKNLSDPFASGFTLLEVILTLLVAAIVGGLLLPYLGSALTRSSTPVKRLAADAALQTAADNIIGAFRQEAPSDVGAWNDFRSGIGAVGTEQNSAYGRYRVLFNNYIQFDGDGNETADVHGTAPEDILKVVIAGTGDDPLTVLLIR